MCTESTIYLYSPRYRNIWTLLHELAHYIYWQYGYPDTGAHGAVWLGIYLWLLDKCAVLPLCAALPSAKKAGLKIRNPLKCSPTTLKRYLTR